MAMANGTVRDRLHLYAAGRHDPIGPMGEKEYFASMDRYCGFAYSELIEQLMTPNDLQDTGVGSLTDAQRAKLNAWLDPDKVVAPGDPPH